MKILMLNQKTGMFYKDIETYVQVAKGLACSKYKIECSGNILKKLLYSTFILLFIL